MILTRAEIEKEIQRGTIRITPFQDRYLNPHSYDLRLGSKIGVYRDLPWYKRLTNFLGITNYPTLDARKENAFDLSDIPDEGIVLQPGKLYLVSTLERVNTNEYVTFVDGKSSLGRYGLFVHVTAGFVDTGFDGHITLELVATESIRIYRGDRICQVRYTPLHGEVALYEGQYRGDAAAGPVPSQFWKRHD